MRILLISGWLVAISIVVVSVVSSVVLPAQCALLGAMGGALYGMWRLGRAGAAGYVSGRKNVEDLGRVSDQEIGTETPAWRELVVPGLRPVLSAAAGWFGLVVLTLVLRVLTADTVAVRPETAWCVAVVLGTLMDPMVRRFSRPRSTAPSLQDGKPRYNDPSL